MKKIVRGNDFTLRIPVRKMVNGEQVAFPLPACTDIQVNIVNQYRRVSLAYSIDTAEDNIILARVEGDAVSVGTYALEVRGKIFGNDWRSKEYEQFSIVDNNASGDTAFNGELIEGEDSVEMNTALVILPPTAELTQLITDANTAIKTAKQTDATLKANESERMEAEQQRESAETSRASEENKRIDNETAREAAETARQNAETERVNDENNRKTSESNRELAEQQRVSAEEERMSNEDARKTAESERANKETERQTAESQRGADEEERKTNETERKAAETQRKEAEETRATAEKSRVSAEKQREATFATTKANCEAATKKASDAAGEATLATSKANASAEKANAAAVAAENVDAALADNVLTVTNRNGESTSLQLASYAEVGDVVSEVKHLSETMGAYTDRPDIVLTAKETNKAISTSGAKVSKSGWAIAEFTAEKGNVYLFKPNVIDDSVCIFAEYIQSVETRGIDYTYTYNSDGTTATATATYLGATHTYTYTYAENKSCVITDETGATVDALPMIYETKVGTYSPLVSLNADAELPKDGYCRYMSHFKGNSAIKVAVSYKVGVADLTMKVTRDGVLASVSTQLGNLSQKEDETRKKIDELHGSWVDVLFLADTTVYVDYKAVIIKGKTRTRLYPKQQLQFGGVVWGSFIPLLWADLSHLTSAIRLSNPKEGSYQGLFQGCKKISSLALNNLDISKNVTLERMFCACSSLQSLSIEGWDVSKVTSMERMFCACSSLQSLSIEGWDVSKVTSMEEIFYGCSSLQSLDLSGWNLESCKKIDHLGQHNFTPKTLKLGTGFFKCPATKASLRFITWTDASVKESLVVNSYDRKANGLPDFTLTLSKQTKAVLSEDDIAAMTAKGYIIA